jgi:hypothetical protein
MLCVAFECINTQGICYFYISFTTHSATFLLQLVPMGRGIIQRVLAHWQRDVTKKLIAPEAIVMPDGHPQRSCFQFALSNLILHNKRT